jgi:hypothetical protein
MKKIILILTFLFSFATLSQGELEVQCKMEGLSFDMVIKRSPDTLRVYALLFTINDLKSYLHLSNDLIEEESNERFIFQNKEKGEYLKIDLTTKSGILFLPLDGLEEKEFKLLECQSTIISN